MLVRKIESHTSLSEVLTRPGPIGWPALASGRLGALLLYLACAVPLAFIGLGRSDVVTMEGIVAEGAREMARTGSFVVPRLHGEIYTYKPPLAYWLAHVSFRLSGGESERSLRLPFALCAVGMGLGVLWLVAGAAGPRAGWLCALASLTGFMTLQKLHLAEFDLPLAAGVGLAVAAACRQLAHGRASPGLWMLAYVGLTFAFLAKGVPALLFYVPGLLAAALATGRLRRLAAPGHVAAALVFVGGASLWAALAYAAEGPSAFEQPLQEAVDKGLSWSWRALGAAVTRPAVVVAIFLPWSLLLPMSAGSTRRANPATRRLERAAWAFALAGTAVFTLVPAQESRYLLPLAVPVGLAAGLALVDPERWLHRGWRRSLTAGFGFLVAVGSLVIASGLTGMEPASGSRLVLAATGCAVAVLADRFLAGHIRSPLALLLWIVISGWACQKLAIEPYRAKTRSLRSVASDFASHLPPGGPVWVGPVSKDFRHSSLTFYLQRPVRTLDPDRTGPEPGDHLLLFCDEPLAAGGRVPFSYRIVERRVQRGCEMALAEVTPPVS